MESLASTHPKGVHSSRRPRQVPEQVQKFLNLKHVSKRFEKNWALKDINLSIKEGEILFLTGPSGAGKTTLLNILAGTLAPTKGVVTARKNLFISCVFQDLKLIENATVEKNLFMSFDPKQGPKSHFKKHLRELTEYFGMTEKLSSPVKNLNRGARQLTGIVRAILSGPDLLLADEPTSALDKEKASRLFELLSYYNKREKMTILWATHNKDLIKNFNGRIVHIDKGKLLYSGYACFI